MNISKYSKVISFLYIIILIFSVHHSAEAKEGGEEAIHLYDSTDKVVLDTHIEILEDKERKWSIEEVSSGELSRQFKFHADGKPNFGYTRSAYWVRFQVVNHSSKQDWLLEIDSPKINRIYLYQPGSTSEYEVNETGNAYLFSQRDVKHRNFVYNMDFRTEEVQTVYLRFTSGGSMQLPLTLYSPSSFNEKSQVEYMIFGIFFGISAVMALYNLFLYISLRHISYLYYVIFIAVNSLLYLSDTGLAYQFIWPEHVGWNLRAIVTFMCLGNAGALLFTKSFLDTRKYTPKLDIIFKILLVLNFVVAIRVQFTFNLAVYGAIFCSFITIILVLTAVILCLRKGYRPARYFLWAWGIFLVGVFISIMVDAGVIPLTLLTKYAWQLTTSIEVILLSFALGDKINSIRDEKELAVREAKESQEIALESLKRSDELKDEFLAITSHELRTPLNGIIGIAETLRDGAAGQVNNGIQQHLSMIIMSGRRLTHLINDILDFSKLKHKVLDIQLKPVHLAELTSVVLTICQPLIQNKSIRLLSTIDIDLPPVSADENRLQQIMYNLIGNAIKYTDSGEVKISAEQEGEFLTITVSDTGKGIPHDQLSSIFDPFHQGDPSLSREASGTGIGLSITKRLVELHQGFIKVESKVGVGSEFSFTLPISHSDHIQYMEEAAPSSAPFIIEHEDNHIISTAISQADNQGVKILIADDELVNLQVLMNQLTLEGYETIAVSNGEEVIKYLQEHSVDLLILDIMMPKISGFEVCRQLRERFSLTELPILMLTAKNQVYDKVTAFEVGANDYLAKPCDKKELLARVKTLIHLGRLSQELIYMNRLLEGKVKERTQALEDANIDLAKVNVDLVSMDQSRRHLLANISHELGTPVTLIQGYVQAVQEGLIEADQPRYLEMVYNKVKILDRLIQDLFDLAKLEAGQISLNIIDISLGKWFEQIIEKSELDSKQGGRLFDYQQITYKPLDHVIVSIDLERMDQVFSNLIWNAIKHTSPEEGKITISAKVQKSDRRVVIQVQDNGQGIEEHHLPYIFDRFFKVTASTKSDESSGTGLGLAITKEIIQSHKGTVWAESSLNQGSTFYISLPILVKREGEEK